uniref:Uncharacterized protein n=1 Tax=Anguilla anguilla TaxID=7936 RepID=A0A0E9XJZ2_ANGAN
MCLDFTLLYSDESSILALMKCVMIYLSLASAQQQ